MGFLDKAKKLADGAKKIANMSKEEKIIAAFQLKQKIEKTTKEISDKVTPIVDATIAKGAEMIEKGEKKIEEIINGGKTSEETASPANNFDAAPSQDEVDFFIEELFKKESQDSKAPFNAGSAANKDKKESPKASQKKTSPKKTGSNKKPGSKK